MHTLKPLSHRYSLFCKRDTEGVFHEKKLHLQEQKRRLLKLLHMWSILSRESALWFNLCQKRRKITFFFPLLLENLVNFSFLTKTTIFFLSYYYFTVPHLNFLTICSADQISRCFSFWAQPANISAGSKGLIAWSANWDKHIIETDKTFISQIPKLFLLSFLSYH